MEDKPFDKKTWNKKMINRYYDAMLVHRPNFDLDTDLFLRFANSLPDNYDFGKVISKIVLFHNPGHRHICEWKIDEDGKVHDFTEEGILKKLEEASINYSLQECDLNSIVRDWKIEILT